MRGKSINLYLTDGTPNGIVTAEISNWTGYVLGASRSRLAELIQRPETSRTGVYCLIGTDQISGKPLVYFGESDNVAKRLVKHNKDDDKEFFERAFLCTSKDEHLTKSHVSYLESRLISIVSEANRAKLKNAKIPELPYLPEREIADTEFFLDQMRIILLALGLDFLMSPSIREEPKHTQRQVLYELTNRNSPGLRAEAQEVGGVFVVLAGSYARRDSGQPHHHYRLIRDSLKSDGVLVQHGDFYRFARDSIFRSPSAASAAILDRNDNGRTTWVLKGTSTTYAELQNEMIAAVAN